MGIMDFLLADVIRGVAELIAKVTNVHWGIIDTVKKANEEQSTNDILGALAKRDPEIHFYYG